MKVERFLLAMVLCMLAACGSTEKDAGGVAEDPASPAVSPVPEPEPESMPMTRRSDASMEHMHAHAEQLDKLKAALDEGDLVAAGTPAYWLARHETLAGLPADLAPYLDAMRDAAGVVGGAADLATARAAAQRLEESCEACHRANET